MYKKDVDVIVEMLQKETFRRESAFSKEEIRERFLEKYSKDQIERIWYRYLYLNSL